MSNFILQANRGGETVFWTGRAGQAWVSTDRSEAFEVSFEEAHRKAELFNQASSLHSLTFEAFSALIVGDKIRSWDHEPMEGRKDRFVEGTISGISDDGRFIVDVDFDSTGRDRAQIFTPIVLFISDFAERLTRISS